MPRKASGITKANAKGGAIAADGTHIINSNELSNVAAGVNAPARGGSSTRGAKRRRTSNNVNSSGTEIYGSGTIIAANPFDDDHGIAPITNHSSSATMVTNKMMVISPSQPGIQMQHHHHTLHFNQQQHAHPQPPHHQQQPQQPQHGQQLSPMHQHPHQNYPPHHQNSHYNTMQQSMSIHPHAQISTPPSHLARPQPTSQHQDLVGHQQHPSPIHNHGNMMPVQHIQNYGPPPPNQQQPQMIGTSTPPQLMGGPVPSHSPYNSMHLQQSSMIAQPQPTITPQPPPPQHPQPSASGMAANQQQPPLSHHIDQMSLQQPYATNHNVYCGKCQREVYQNELNIICKAGCKLYFHISCSGLTPLACDLLLKESLAEWACDRCTSGTRRVPFVKYKT